MLLAIKLMGAVIATVVGILGLFSDTAYNKKTHRVTHIGLMFMLLIIGGSTLSFAADFLKGLDDSAQTRAQLNAINRAVYPFSDLRFGFKFEADLKDPLLANFEKHLRYISERASRGHGIDGSWEGLDWDSQGPYFSFWADSQEAMSRLFPSGEEEAFYSIFDVSEVFAVFAGNSRPPTSAEELTRDAIYESSCCTQTITAYGGGNYVMDKRQALILYYPRTAHRPEKCYIWMHPYALAPGAPFRATTSSVGGLADLTGKWLVLAVEPSGKAMHPLPLRLKELDLQIGKQRTTIFFSSPGISVLSPGTPADYSAMLYTHLEPTDFNTLLSQFIPVA